MTMINEFDEELETAVDGEAETAELQIDGDADDADEDDDDSDDADSDDEDAE